METTSPIRSGRQKLGGFFGPDSVTWRMAGEMVMLLGGGRAVLMQLAHPLVAAGVDQHSAYATDPWGRVWRTLELTQQITFGTWSEATAAAHTINRLHHGVTGMLAAGGGTFAPGTPYRARPSAAAVGAGDADRYRAPALPDAGRAADASRGGALLPGEPPGGCTARTVGGAGAADSGRFPGLYVRNARRRFAGRTPAAQAVARVDLRMPAPAPLRPLLAATEQVTVGLLPPRLREFYGLTWNGRRQALLEAWAAGTRRVLPLLPPAVRRMPRARAAWRRVRSAPQAA